MTEDTNETCAEYITHKVREVARDGKLEQSIHLMLLYSLAVEIDALREEVNALKEKIEKSN